MTKSLKHQFKIIYTRRNFYKAKVHNIVMIMNYAVGSNIQTLTTTGHQNPRLRQLHSFRRRERVVKPPSNVTSAITQTTWFYHQPLDGVLHNHTSAAPTRKNKFYCYDENKTLVVNLNIILLCNKIYFTINKCLDEFISPNDE